MNNLFQKIYEFYLKFTFTSIEKKEFLIHVEANCMSNISTIDIFNALYNDSNNTRSKYICKKVIHAIESGISVWPVFATFFSTLESSIIRYYEENENIQEAFSILLAEYIKQEDYMVRDISQERALYYFLVPVFRMISTLFFMIYSSYAYMNDWHTQFNSTMVIQAYNAHPVRYFVNLSYFIYEKLYIIIFFILFMFLLYNLLKYYYVGKYRLYLDKFIYREYSSYQTYIFFDILYLKVKIKSNLINTLRFLYEVSSNKWIKKCYNDMLLKIECGELSCEHLINKTFIPEKYLFFFKNVDLNILEEISKISFLDYIRQKKIFYKVWAGVLNQTSIYLLILYVYFVFHYLITISPYYEIIR